MEARTDQRARGGSRSPLRWAPGLLALAALVAPGLVPAAAAQVCARVKIEIVQEVTLERQAFDAKLKITNGATDVPISDLGVDVSFQDADGNEVAASSDPNAVGASFFVALDSLDGVDSVDGDGTIAGGAVGEVHWLIIPAPGAAAPGGSLYMVGAKLTYRLGGELHTTDVAPDTITVRPMPELHLDYFLPEQVHGDNPYTEPVEPAEPFTLGVRVANQGLGPAESLAIESGQPKIVDNEQGLLIAFEIIGSDVDGAPATTSLKAAFGDLPPGEASVARWFMTASLQGRFVSFDASFTHDDALGGSLTSLLEDVRTHPLIHDVWVDLPGRDDRVDFLGLDGAGNVTVYESDLVDGPVWDASGEAELVPAGGDAWTLTVPPTGGFSWARVDDPHAGTREIASVVRADGRVVRGEGAANAWLSRTWVKDAQSHTYHLEIFDTGNPLGLPYTVTFGGVVGANHAPLFGFLPDRAVRVGEPLAYGVAATDPDGTVPIVQVGQALPGGAAFIALGGGEGRLDWTPAPAQLGAYPILFEATDGALFAKALPTIHVVPAGTPNAAPASVEAAIQTTVDTPSAPVTPTVVDADGGPHWFQVTDAPAHGTAAVVDNQVVYTPAPGYTGPDAFGLRAVDLFGEAVEGAATVLVTGFDNLVVDGVTVDGAQAVVAVRLEADTAPVTPVVLEVRAARCGQEAVIGSVSLVPEPGAQDVAVPLDLAGLDDAAVVLVAVLDAGGALPEPDELDNRASAPLATGGASLASFSIGSSGAETRQACAGQALAVNGRAVWGLAEGPCHDIAAAGQPVAWRLLDADGAVEREGEGRADAFGAWHLETGLPPESMALHDLEVTVGSGQHADVWTARLVALPCDPGVPPPMVPDPPYPGPGGGTPVVVFADGASPLPWLVHPGTPIPTAGEGGSGTRGATWGTGASDQAAPGGPAVGDTGGVAAAFDAWVTGLAASPGAQAGEPVRLTGAIGANDSRWGLPVRWRAEGPAGALEIAPVTWFYANGTLHVAATWTPPAGGAWTVTLETPAGDADPGNDAATIGLEVTPQVPAPDGLALWLDAESGVQATGGVVTAWTDRSGHSMDATPATGAPLLVTGPHGAAVRFGGADSLALPDGFAGLEAVTVVAVVAPERAAPMAVLDLPGGAGRLGLGLDADARLRWTAGKRVVAGGPEAELGAPRIVTLVHAGSQVSGAVGGEPALTGTARLPEPGAHVGSRVGAGDPLLGGLRGDLQALLVYGRALPAAERAALEAWLADRHGAWHPDAAWVAGLPSPVATLAAAHRWCRAEAEAYAAWAAQNPGAPIPGDGLALWLRADTVERTGTAVTGWPDRSPAGAGAVAVSASAEPTWVADGIGGQPALRFDGVDDALALATGLADLRRAGVTVAAVFRSPAARRSAPLLSLRAEGAAGVVALRRIGEGPAALLSTDGGSLVGDAGLESTAPRLLWAHVGPDGAAAVGAEAGMLPRPAGLPRDGSRIGRDAKGQGFAGDVAELLVWDRQLDAGERDAVALALAERYGLWHPGAAWVAALDPATAALAAANGWTQGEAQAHAAFAAAHPGVPAGLGLWLRADQGVTATGGAVSAWDDQSAAGADGVQPVAAERPVLAAGVRFDGVDDGLALPAGFGRFDGATVVAVARAGNARAGAPLFEARTASGKAVGLGAGLRWTAGGAVSGPGLLPGRLEVVAAVHRPDGATGAVELRTGGATVATGALPLPAPALREIAGVGRAGGNAFAGELHELMVWQRALTEQELLAVEAGLADAWGAWHPQASWVAALAGLGATPDDVALAATHGWSQAQAAAWLAWQEVWAADGPPGEGLALWLRATVGVDAPGGAVAAWSNLAPVEVAAAASPDGGAPAVVPFGEGQAVRFDGEDDALALPPGLAALDGGFTVVLVARPVGVHRWERLLELAGPTAADLVSLRRKSTSAALQVRVGGASLDAAQALGQEARILSVVVAPGGATVRSQGVVRATGALPLPTAALRDRSRLGRGAGGEAAFGGDVVELLVWERALGAAELQAAEAALADALALYHPDAAWIAAFPPDQAALIHTNRWNRDQAEAALP